MDQVLVGKEQNELGMKSDRVLSTWSWSDDFFLKKF